MTAPIDGIGMTSARTRDRLVKRLQENGIRHPGVLEAIRNTPRHLFVDEALSSRAYEDTALPIGHGQTISQPWVVARMTEAIVETGRPGKVLEIGTGCGYQTAVMSGLVDQVFTLERISALLQRARKTLRQIGIRNVRFQHGDGFEGWADHAPFDAILAAAAPEQVPESLLHQMADGGVLVIPVGPAGRQELLRIHRVGNQLEQENLGLVSFVPLRGGRI
ncbi:protein-L-isoaspartate(D-aspartate) O-methyltransferase [Natronospira proteinivora]|uniref:Protein-L-isoaspartate O-methyltransferase n=1 Tax=Natronospira proteinivora TaxID=1807133 RepID=A0ABT1G8H7_9GAMM|nr:protein-L-isoaspartate(D-aspartate) O-methyltransferase [Natronospira proteinivora]MCP1726648.1 protein-L-isoaspartate(D-aspartate) O-methyltransferase [Natronospira proteinivora]